MDFRRYFKNILIAIDQLFNAAGGGDPDETLSSRWGKCSRQGNRVCRVLCRILNVFDPKHCTNSIEDAGDESLSTNVGYSLLPLLVVLLLIANSIFAYINAEDEDFIVAEGDLPMCEIEPDELVETCGKLFAQELDDNCGVGLSDDYED